MFAIQTHVDVHVCVCLCVLFLTAKTELKILRIHFSKNSLLTHARHWPERENLYVNISIFTYIHTHTNMCLCAAFALFFCFMYLFCRARHASLQGYE